MKEQVDISHYEFETYWRKDRFFSWYYQVKLITELKPDKMLEIGPGGSFLRKNIPDGVEYFSADISKDLAPDVLASATTLPFSDSSVDLVGAFQVLEHIPFEKFEEAVKEIARAAKSYFLLSLPYAAHQFRLSVKFPLIGERTFSALIPKSYVKHKFDGQHYWEIGKKGYPLKRIEEVLTRYFIIEDKFIPDENLYHQFFVLKKK